MYPIKVIWYSEVSKNIWVGEWVVSNIYVYM